MAQQKSAAKQALALKRKEMERCSMGSTLLGILLRMMGYSSRGVAYGLPAAIYR
jgi:hypothetical protein